MEVFIAIARVIFALAVISTLVVGLCSALGTNVFPKQALPCAFLITALCMSVFFLIAVIQIILSL
jgi:hypothetical protein